MASEALETIVGMLRSEGPIEGGSVQEMRAAMEAGRLAATPVPRGRDVQPRSMPAASRPSGTTPKAVARTASSSTSTVAATAWGR